MSVVNQLARPNSKDEPSKFAEAIIRQLENTGYYELADDLRSRIVDFSSLDKPTLVESDDWEPTKSGSCFFVTQDGLAVTNYHVVEDSVEIAVRAGNGSILPASVIDESKSSDLALLSTQHSNTTPLAIAPINSLEIGETVFTIGFPIASVLGGQAKFTEGTVSSLVGPNDSEMFVQVSVPIQPGNSGGALINHKGQIVWHSRGHSGS